MAIWRRHKDCSASGSIADVLSYIDGIDWDHECWTLHINDDNLPDAVIYHNKFTKKDDISYWGAIMFDEYGSEDGDCDNDLYRLKKRIERYLY